MNQPVFDDRDILNEPDKVVRFKEAVDKFAKKNFSTPEKKRAAFIRVGILGKDGKLSPDLR